MPLTRRALIQALLVQAAVGRVSAQARVHNKPKPLAKDAVTHDWTSFLGPAHNATSTETRLSRTLAATAGLGVRQGHQLRVAGGSLATGFSSCIVSATKRSSSACTPKQARGIGASGTQLTSKIATDTTTGRDRARSSTAIASTRSERRANSTASISSRESWCGRATSRAEYKVPQDFFGTASTPLVEDKLLVLNVGAPGGPCVVGLDKMTGREVWRAGKEWGPSYASPVPAVVHGKRRIFVFAGGESTPPTGGLLSIDPATGRVDFSFPWRSRSYESVNASCPVVFDNKVFISASYRTGGALLEIRPDFTHRVVWTTQEFGLHWNTPIYRNGFLYGFDGRNEPDASLACVDAASGKIVWRATPEWNETFTVGGTRRQQLLGAYRGSLLAVDGQFLCLGEMGHLVWMDLTPKGYKEISHAWLFAARESWALPVLSRGLLYVVQNTRDVVNGVGPRLLCYDLRAQ